MTQETTSRKQRLERLWEAADDAFWRRDYRRCLKIATIIARFGSPRWDAVMARDWARCVRQVREVQGQNPPAIYLSHHDLDQLPGPDENPIEDMIEKEANAESFAAMKKIVLKDIAARDWLGAHESLCWMLSDYPEQDLRWPSAYMKLVARNLRALQQEKSGGA